jgi:hypothetical protein
MRQEKWTLGYPENKSSMVLMSSTIIVVFFMIIGCLIQTFNAGSEPIVNDNLDGTFTAEWTLDNASEYALFNLTMKNGSASLNYDSFWWNQTAQSEFETGTTFNIDTLSSPGNLILNSTSLGGGANLIKNGDFKSNSDWSFDSSGNITSEWISSGEYGKLHHYSASNPPIIKEHFVSSGISDGDNGGSGAIDLVDALQASNDGKYWRLLQNQYISITGFDVAGRTGKIVKVVLWGRHQIDPSRYDGDSTLEYKNESGVFQSTSIQPSTSTVWVDHHQDITDGYSSWTWNDVANLELNFINNDVNPQNNRVEWDRIWLNVTIERFDQTAYISQTFEVFNTTGFTDTLYEDFLKNTENHQVNFTLEPDAVMLDYASSFSTGQTTLYANDPSGGASYIGKDVWQDLNFGGDTSIWVGGTLQTFRSLIRFDTSSIPSNAIITDATLELWVETISNNIPINIYRITQNWDEGFGDSGGDNTDGVTWVEADINPWDPWVEGGQYDSPVYESSTVSTSEPNSWHSFNITTLVQEWVDGESNFGLILKDASEGLDRTVSFTSDEGSSAQRPQLIIDWALPNYHTYGNFTSQVFGAEKIVNNWGNISWDCTTPTDTTIGIETCTSIDNISWSIWSNCPVSGDGISSPPGRYIQYRAHLQTSNPATSPTLYDVTIIFSRTNLTFDRIVENFINNPEAEMSIAINDTVVWGLPVTWTSSWTPELVDISEQILSKGLYNISLRLHLIIETNNEVNCSVGFDNIAIGGLANESRGEYISIGFDAGSQAIWKEINWNVSLFPETKIIIQTRTSSDNSFWEPWSPAYSNPSGDPITSSDYRYIQYRAILQTTNSSNSPVLSDINIFYSIYSWNGTLEMKNDLNAFNVVDWGVFTTDDNLVQWINFSYSTDSGNNWDPVPSSGDMSSATTSSGKIRFKANFTIRDTSITPILLGFSLTYLSNNIPQLLNGGYINETGALGGGWFNFSLIYLDLDDDYPISVKLIIIGQGNYNLGMNELDAGDVDVIDGKWFYHNMTLPKGSYQYRFMAYDGLTWNATTFVSFTVNNNPAKLKYVNVMPPTGTGGDSFNFTVAYFDSDNDAPLLINLTIIGTASNNLTMIEQDNLDVVYSDGKDYYYNLVLDKGSYTYFFTAFDGEVWSSTASSILYVENNPPELSLPFVSPSSGNMTSTFNFTVLYSDFDDDPPGMVTLNISGPSMSGSYIMMEVDPSDNNSIDGKLYYFQLSSLIKGPYTYHFAANDSDGDWGDSTDIFLLNIMNSKPQIITPDVLFADEDSFYSIYYQYFDIDNDTCVWLLDTNASWLTIGMNTGYLNGTPDNGDVGWFLVNITLSDNDGGLDWTLFILNVNNSVPQIFTTTPTNWAVENQQYSFDFNGEDEAEGNAYWYFNSNASWLNIDPLNGVLFGTPGAFDVGWYWVNITLHDGNGGYDTLDFTIIVNDISPPIADAGEDGLVWEDSVYVFDGSGSTDNSGQISNYTWYFGDEAVGYGLNPTHVYKNKGVYLVVLVAHDATGNGGYDTLEITVQNPSPVAIAGSDRTANEGEEVYFDASGSYDTPSDNSSLTFMWDFDGDGKFDDGVGVAPSFIWYDEGIYTISLKVIDDNGNSSIDTLNVTVGNLPPVVVLGDSYLGLEGERIYFFTFAQDAGNDVLRYRWDWNYDGINDTGWSTKSYANHTWPMFGIYTIEVQVWDGDNGYANDIALVEVIRPEQPPVISGVGGRYVHFDYPYLLDLAPYVYDPDTPKDGLIVTTSEPTYIKVSGLILTLLYPETMRGHTDIVIISVSDGKNMDNDTLTVSITANYPPEVRGDIPDVSFNEGEVLKDAMDLDNYFMDKDNDTLSYHFLGNLHVRTEINSSTKVVTFSAGPNWYGIENLTVRAYDTYGAFTEQVIKVTVNEVNFPPTIGGIQDVYVRLNSPWELLVLNPVYVWDDDSILNLFLSTDSSFVTLSPIKEGVLVFYYLDPSITTEIVQISVSDGEYTASTTVTVHISLLNWPPHIKDTGYPSTVRFDEDTMLSDLFNLNDYFADNETDTLTFTPIMTSSDVFVSINEQGMVSFSARENWFGLALVTFRAQDNSGAWISFVVNVTVNSVNDVPEIVQKITYLRVKEDETWIIDLDDYFEDIEDGDNLTFTCNKPDIVIDPLTHEARWKRNGKNSLKDVVFTASDGEASVSMEEVNLKVVETFNWLWMIVAAIFGALGVLVYRELRYRYKVEEAFLLNNAGIILTHLSKGESKMVIDVELVGAMLTAVRDFVKDSFSNNEKDSDVIVDKKRSLEKLEFGGFHLVLEQGNSSCLCAVISGYVNNRLRKRMKTVLGEFEGKYAIELQDWDGMVETFEEAQAIIAELFKLGGRTEQLQSSLNVIREVVDEDYEMAFEEMSISEPIEEADGGKEEESFSETG